MSAWLYVACISAAIIVYSIIDLLLRLPRIDRHADRYIVVTGCDTGFGHELCKRLDSLGCHVFAGCLTEKGETELKKCCSRRLVTIHMDVSKPDSVRDALNVVTVKLDADTTDLWAVVNNAGVASDRFGPPEWLTVDDYRVTADVNLYGLIDVTMTFLPLVKKSRGRVVNMSSLAGRFSLFALYAYCASKHGVEVFTDGLRRAMRPYGVRAVLIEPTLYWTNIVDTYQESVSRAWRDLTPELRREYGEDYLSYLTTDRPEAVRPFVSANIQEVVDAYEQAVLGRYPRPRYRLGSWVTWFYIRVIGSLPECVGDWLLEKIDWKRPLPAALRTAQSLPGGGGGK